MDLTAGDIVATEPTPAGRSGEDRLGERDHGRGIPNPKDDADHGA